jgi:hypothetical protein
MSSVTLNGQTFDSDDWDAAGYLHPTTGWFAHLSALLAEIGKGTFDVSTSSNDIGTGEKTWTLTNKRPVTVGSWVVVAEAGTPTNFCAGAVTAYNTSTGALTVDVAVTGGSGTGVASWTVIHGGAYEPADATILKSATGIAQGKHTFWIPAGAQKSRVSNGCAAATYTETSTNKVNLPGLGFDASTIEYGQSFVWLPKSYNGGTITAIPVWWHPATTTNFKVSWGLQGVAFGDGSDGDTAFGTAIYSNDTGGVTNHIYFGPETAEITLGGSPAGPCLACFQMLRKADDATNDTLAVDAMLLGWVGLYTINAATDA